MKIAVIGGGISGISLAREASNKAEVHVFEKEATPGGLIRCADVEGNLYHKVGGHVFNTKNQKIAEWFWKHFDRDREFIKAKRNAKILLHGKMVGYPLENYLYQLDPSIISNVIDDILSLDKGEYKDPMSYPNFEAFLRGNFGSTLYEIYFKPYNYKIWKTDLSKVAVKWLEGKLPMPDYKQIILSNIVQQEESEMVHSSFYYAKEGGSQFIIDRLSQGVSIYLNTPVSKISKLQGGWSINDGHHVYDRVVYTGDVRKLHQVLYSDNEQVNDLCLAVKDLKSHGTSNVFCECDESDLSWLYLPDPALQAHRIIYTGNFSINNNKGSSRKTCVVEFSGSVPEAEMKEELKLLPGRLHPLAFNYEPNSYVIQEDNTSNKIAQLKQVLASRNMYLLGRFAEWEYYNMDKAIESAIKLSDMIIK